MSRPRAAALACLVFFAVAVVAPPALAQWSSDPAVNSPIAVKSGDQVQPKVRPIPGGAGTSAGSTTRRAATTSTFSGLMSTAWRSGPRADPGRGPRLQLDEDYGLDVDGSGNALLAFDDDRFATRRITATKIDPREPALGRERDPDPETTGDVHSPKIAAASDGRSSWPGPPAARSSCNRMQADGTAVWDRVRSSSGLTFGLADLRAAGGSDTGAIVSWCARSRRIAPGGQQGRRRRQLEVERDAPGW